MCKHISSLLFVLITTITASQAFGQVTVYSYLGDNSNHWGNGLNWYAYHPESGTQTNGSVPISTDAIVVSTNTAKFASGTAASPIVYTYTGPFEMVNSNLTTTAGEWDTHNTTLALGGTTTVRGLNIGGGLEVRNEGAMTLDYDGNGNGNLGSYDKFRMRNAVLSTVDIITTEGSSRIISLGYYGGYYTNEGVTRINTVIGSSVTFQKGYYGGSVNNSGSFEKSGVGNLTANYYTQASTGGTFVEGGEFRALGSSLNGIIDVSAGATFRLSGNAVFLDGLEGRGAGSYLADAGTIRPEGNSTLSNLTLNGATITNEVDASTLTVGDLNIMNGIIGSNYALSSVVATGSASTITGDIKFAGNYTTQLPAFTNAGTLTWSGGGISANNRMYLANTATGTFIADADIGTTRTMSGGYYGGWFQNDGTVQKTGHGTIQINAYYRDSGSTQIDAGILSFGSGGSSSGSFILAADGTARVSNGTFKLLDGFSTTGSGLFEVSNGVLAPTGSNAISHLAVSGGQIYNEAAVGTLTAGNVYLSAGTIGSNETLSSTIATGSNSTISGSIKFAGNYTTQLPAFTNAGTLTWSGGSISANNRMYLANSSSGTFIADAAIGTTRTMSGGYYGGWFQNDGIVRKTGDGTIAINANYRGSGDTEVQSGILSFGGGGNVSGNFNLSAGSSALVTNGTLTLQDGVSVTGSGLFDVRNGTLTPTGNNTIANLAVSGGKVYNEAQAGTLTVGNLHMSAGTIGADETLTTTIATGSNSTITGSIKFEGNYSTQVAALTNTGTMTWSDGSISASNRMYFTNADGGTFIADAAVGTTRNVTGGYYSGWFQNDGTVRKTGAGTIEINTHYRGSGHLQIDSGNLNLQGGGTLSGTATIASGATLGHANGTLTLSDGFTATGLGRVANSGGNLLIEGTTSIARLDVTGGNVGINESDHATLNVGNLNLSGGSIGYHNTQATVINTGPDSTITGNVTITGSRFNSVTALSNAGTITWSGGNISGGTRLMLQNAAGGTFVAEAGEGVTRTLNGGTYGGSFLNEGTLQKTGAGTITIASSVNNQGNLSIEGGHLQINGTLTTGAASTLTLSNGASFGSTSALTLAALTGSGSITSNITVTTDLSPGSSPGLLAITGNLTLTSSATSSFEIEGLIAGTNYDQVTTTGSILLDGMLAITVSPLFAESLTDTDSFDLLIGSSRTGTFANVADGSRLVDTNGLGSFLASYTDTGLQLNSWQSSATAVPEPATTVVLLGLASLCTALFRRRIK